MIRVTFLLVPLLLIGCDGSESERKSEAQEAAGRNMLKGEAVKSPVLDYSQFDGPPPIGKKAEPSTTPNPSDKRDHSSKESSGFKKSPVLDYSKF